MWEEKTWIALWYAIHSDFLSLWSWYGEEEWEKTKASKEYNKKTLRLMGFIENDEGEWVKKGVTTPQQSVLEDEKADEEAEEEEA